MADLATKADLFAVKADLQNAMASLEENLSLRLTVRLGVMFAGGIAALAAIMKLL